MWKRLVVGAFNQEKALVGAFSVIVKSSRTFFWISSLLKQIDSFKVVDK